MLPLIYLIIVGIFGLFSLVIVYHLYRFGVNKAVINLVILIYIIISIFVILNGLAVIEKVV